MSRSGYDDYGIDDSELNRWRGAVASAIRGKRGQAFLLELVAALDALPEKRLARNSLQSPEGCCAFGAVARRRELSLASLDDGFFDREDIASLFGVAEALAAEVMHENDDGTHASQIGQETPEQRFTRMRAWALENLRPETLIVESL